MNEKHAVLSVQLINQSKTVPVVYVYNKLMKHRSTLNSLNGRMYMCWWQSHLLHLVLSTLKHLAEFDWAVYIANMSAQKTTEMLPPICSNAAATDFHSLMPFYWMGFKSVELSSSVPDTFEVFWHFSVKIFRDNWQQNFLCMTVSHGNPKRMWRRQTDRQTRLRAMLNDPI